MATAPIKKRHLIGVFLALMVGIIYILQYTPPSIPLESGILRIGTDPSNPPFAFYQENQLVGLEIEIARTIAQKLGVSVEFVPIGYDATYDALATDRVDAMIASVVIAPHKTKDVRYTLPYFDMGLVLVSPLSTYANFQAKVGTHLALELGSDAHNETQGWGAYLVPFEQLYYERPQYALESLKKGIASSALVDNLTYQQFQLAHPDWQVTVTTVTSTPLAIAVRLDRPQMWQLLNEQLKALIHRGELSTMITKWLTQADNDTP